MRHAKLVPGQETNRDVDLVQLEQIICTLESEADSFIAPVLCRKACELGKGRLTYRSFMEAAQKTQFLTKCLRLPTHYGAELAEEFHPRDKIGILDSVRLGWALNKNSMYEIIATLDANEQSKCEIETEMLCDALDEGKQFGLCALSALIPNAAEQPL